MTNVQAGSGRTTQSLKSAGVVDLPARACPLCATGEEHPVRVSLYDAYRHLRNKTKRAQGVQAALDEHDLSQVTLEEVETHMRYHEPAWHQPKLRSRQVDARLDEVARWLNNPRNQRARQAVQTVCQVRVMTARQMTELLHGEADTDDSPAAQQTRRLLLILHYAFLLQRVPCDPPIYLKGRDRADSVYAVGPIGARLFAAQHADHPQNMEPKVPAGAKGIRRNVLTHDLSCTDVLFAMRRSAEASTHSLRNGEVRVSVDDGNWWASDWLGCGVTIPAHINEFGERRPAQLVAMWPDGMGALGVRLLSKQGPDGPVRPDPDDPRSSFLLPILLEYDTGKRTLTAAAEQVLRYQHAYRDRVFAQRFPDLDVPGYQPPMLMVCEGDVGPTGRETPNTGWGRCRNILREVRDLARARGFRDPMPVLLTTRHALYASGLTAKALPLSADPAQPDEQQQVTLLDHLLWLSRDLVASGRLSADSRLLPMPDEAAIRGGGVREDRDAARSRSARERKRDEQAQAAALAEQAAALAEQAEARRRALAKTPVPLNAS